MTRFSEIVLAHYALRFDDDGAQATDPAGIVALGAERAQEAAEDFRSRLWRSMERAQSSGDYELAEAIRRKYDRVDFWVQSIRRVIIDRLDDAADAQAMIDRLDGLTESLQAEAAKTTEAAQTLQDATVGLALLEKIAKLGSG